ncbi:winged helix-turn-helix domain-containing protein [Paracoccus marinaquae]|uniref:Winged helix-turn-helix domain-containing protein n=1 Tax=Paracoccus marinaquae TaxID=2841926 RepID=A0ABS6AN48_9RHOB|nr:winged helix-turn-helix domain-containing protein [Paracoccus marinaquae]MBU3030876.1 winged helix-turn-helix domain-containing protein [Paracoccus marinaquae]
MPKLSEILAFRSATGQSFNGASIDTGRRGVIGPDGVFTPLRPKSFEVLRHLAGEAGGIVSKDALFDRVWAGQAVTEDSLTQCVGDIRRALGDEDKRVLETVPRVGFRLHADRRGAGLRRRRLAALAAGAAVVLFAAVLILRDPAGEVPPTIAIASDGATAGLAGDLGHALGRYGSLTRVSRAARFELDLSSTTRGRVLASVTDTATGRVIFSRTFDDEDGLAVRLAARLASPLNGEIARVLFAASENKPVAELTPLECYLISYQLQGNQNNDRIAKRSDACLSALLARNPRDARALALRGALYAQQYWWGVGLDEPARSDPGLRAGLASRALVSVERAEALHPPPDAATYYAMARAYYANCQREQTLATARRALEINPDDPNILGGVGNWTAYVGRWEEGAALARRAIDLAPQGYARWWYWPIGKAAWVAGDYEAALDGFMNAYDETSWLSQVQLAYTLPYLDRLPEARRAVERLRELRPGFTRQDARFAYERWCFPEAFITKMDRALELAGLPDAAG